VLITGKWREVDLKKYDVNLESAPIYPGKIHPFVKILDENKISFIIDGFTEVPTLFG